MMIGTYADSCPDCRTILRVRVAEGRRYNVTCPGCERRWGIVAGTVYGWGASRSGIGFGRPSAGRADAVLA